ncbi:hypothetical protein F5883DRAFT_523879 [Diaporthe sp. PMI_573]|nr:hypothetical protein F5883DRAFT_523879 [Diaporthaceae sp. PMI_573]
MAPGLLCYLQIYYRDHKRDYDIPHYPHLAGVGIGVFFPAKGDDGFVASYYLPPTIHKAAPAAKNHSYVNVEEVKSKHIAIIGAAYKEFLEIGLNGLPVNQWFEFAYMVNYLKANLNDINVVFGRLGDHFF